jgi:hypothetical protein
MTRHFNENLAQRIATAAESVLGDSPLSRSVIHACEKYENEVRNITQSRGVAGLLLAIVGAKGQGKTWVARQLVDSDPVRQSLRSGDLTDDATTRLVWIGPTPPEGFDPETEIYHRCASDAMLDIGRPYVLLDTPGSTDANPRAAAIASEALSLAPIKILVVARDQMRSAASISIAQRIDGSECVPVISSVEPEELTPGTPGHEQLQRDLRTVRTQIASFAPRVRLAQEILVPDFEISGDEQSSVTVLRRELTQRLADLKIDDVALNSTRSSRLSTAEQRLRRTVGKLLAEEVPHLASAVDHLNQETAQLPHRVLSSMLGSSQVLETGVRMRLRTQLVADTYLVWFPYRTLMSTLNLTQGAWDRVVLALSGSVPSLFGALASWARNVRQSREFSLEVQEGIRERMQRQVEDHLTPLCDQFHRAVLRLRSDADPAMGGSRASGSSGAAPLAGAVSGASGAMRLTGIEELQRRSRTIFDEALARNATRRWVAQLLAVIGVLLFWGFMAGPIVSIYRQYFSASYGALFRQGLTTADFPHPSAGLIFTSLILSLLPLVVYAMLVLTLALSRSKVLRVVDEITSEHTRMIEELEQSRIVQLQFEDEQLQQAEFLLNLSRAQAGG